MTMIVSWNALCFAHEQPSELLSEETLDTCEEGILSIIDGKAYLRPDKLGFLNNKPFLLSDYQQWIPLSRVFQDQYGYYARSKAAECPRGHTGFKKRGGVWYCFEDGCPYFYGDNF